MSSDTRQNGFSVLVFDMSRTGEADGERLISGFESMEAARAYCEARVRASVEELRSPGQPASALRSMWYIYGEDCRPIGIDWRGSDDLDRYIAEPATAEQTDWPALAPRPAGGKNQAVAVPTSRRFHAAVLISNATDESVWAGGYLRLPRMPSRDDLLALYSADAIAAFGRKGIADVTPASIHVAHLHELPLPPRPPADGRPLRNWDVSVDFVCHDIKFGSSARGVFAWPEQPDENMVVTMARVLIADKLALRGDGPDYVDYTDILGTRVSETTEAPDYPLDDQPA